MVKRVEVGGHHRRGGAPAATAGPGRSGPPWRPPQHAGPDRGGRIRVGGAGRRPAAGSAPAPGQGRLRQQQPDTGLIPGDQVGGEDGQVAGDMGDEQAAHPRKLITSAVPAIPLSRATSSYRLRELSTDGADGRGRRASPRSRSCRLHRGCSLLVGRPRGHRREGSGSTGAVPGSGGGSGISRAPAEPVRDQHHGREQQRRPGREDHERVGVLVGRKVDGLAKRGHRGPRR